MDCYAAMYIIQNAPLLGQTDDKAYWVSGSSDLIWFDLWVTKCDPAQHCYTSVGNETSIRNVVMTLVNM